MSTPMIAVAAVKAEIESAYAVGYFVDALSRLVSGWVVSARKRHLRRWV
jgi:hypothetical protein